jgi:integrase
MGAVFRKTVTKPLPASAELFMRKGEQFARWSDAKGKSRTAPLTTGRDGTSRIVLTARTYTAKYRDGSGIVREISTGCRDEQAARVILNELETRAVRVKSRIVSRAEDAVIDHQVTLLEKHIDDYTEHQRAKGLHPTRVSNAIHRLGMVANDCGWHQLADLGAAAMCKWLIARAADGMSASTRNEYLQEWNCFSNWCVDTQRLIANPLGGVQRADTKGDRRRQRRALTEAELSRLLHVAKMRPLAERGRLSMRPIDDGESKIEPGVKSRRRKWHFAQLTFDEIDAAEERARHRMQKTSHRIEELERLGHERALIYKTLVLTGLRRGELASLSIGQLHLDGPRPYAELHAADEKNRQGSQIPLRCDLAVELSAWIANRRTLNRRDSEAVRGQSCLRMSSVANNTAMPLTTRLFKVPDKLVKILNRDLALAGISKRDEWGRTVDVHALRHCFGTLLSRSGVAPRTAQAAMRHSTIDLTMNVYTDPKLLDIHQAVESLPDLTFARPSSPEHRRATATFGAASQFAPAFAPTLDNSSKSLATAVITAGENETLTSPTCESVSAAAVKRNNPLSTRDNGLYLKPAAGVEPATPAVRMRCSAN